jgi:diguanylate cyclase (GGDEF)-like protein
MTILGSGHPLYVFRQADQAMYLAKSRGVPYAVFGRDLPEWAGSRTAMFAAVDRLSAERDELADLARTDWLTKLGNPLAMGEAFDHVTAQARRSGRPYSVLFVDIDYFSYYNHVHGDHEGDEVLKTVAALLQDSCRGGDVVYRKGGEEFVVLLPDTFSATAVGVAERLRVLIERQGLPHRGRPSGPPVLTVTVGVATLGSRDWEGSDSVRVRAGQLVMDAKKQGELGRNRVHVESAQ